MGFEESKKTILKAFMSYAGYATEVLTGSPSEKGTQGSLRVAFIAPVHHLRSLVESLESSAKFKSLCSGLVGELKRHGLPYDSAVLASALENFFKRSHFYNDTYDGKTLNLDNLFESFWSLLPTRKVKTTRLRLIDGGFFESTHLDFGLFRIQKFSKEELDELIDRQVTDVFYPYAKQDTDLLSEFCFTVQESIYECNLGDSSEEPRDLGDGSEEASGARSLSREESELIIDKMTTIDRDLPDRVIQLLALHNVKDTDLMSPLEVSRGLKLRFLGVVDDDLFTNPPRPDLIPPYVGLERPSIKELEEDCFYHSNCLEFFRESELYLKNIIEKAQRIHKLTKEVNDWDFIKIAMGYLGKALVTDEPLDRLLWYVTVLDALLSEENAGVGQVMKRRICNMLGESEAEKKVIRKRFEEVYEFRSQLVHGKRYKQKAREGHIYDARELARQAVVWFIDYLLWVDESLCSQKVDYGHYPRRSELVAVLDYSRDSLDRLNLLIPKIPQSFPRLAGAAEAYIDQVKRRVMAVWRLPEKLDGRKVILHMHLERSGRVSNVRVDKSSGDKKRDHSAVKAVRTASPFPSVPESAKFIVGDLHMVLDPLDPTLPGRSVGKTTETATNSPS